MDASHFKMHPGAPAEPVLAAWGMDTDGKPVFAGLVVGLTAPSRRSDVKPGADGPPVTESIVRGAHTESRPEGPEHDH